MGTMDAPSGFEPVGDLRWRQQYKPVSPIDVLIADDSTLIRRGLVEVLGAEESLKIVGEAADGNEAVEKALVLKPHIVLMDLNMPNCGGVEATRRLQLEMPEVNIVMFTVSDAEADLVSALKAGARGYLLKSEEPQQIIQAIHYVTHGGILVSSSMAVKLLAEFKSQGMTMEGIDRGLHQEGGEIETPPTELVPDEPPTETPELSAAETEAVGSSPTLTPGYELADDENVSEFDLLLPAPLEPRVVLKLHQWLREIKPSLNADTVMTIAHRGAMLPQMLAGLPFVARVAEELHVRDDAAVPVASNSADDPEREATAGEGDEQGKEEGSPEATSGAGATQQTSVAHTVRKRLRVLLKVE